MHETNEKEEEEEERGEGEESAAASRGVYSLAKDVEDVYRVPTSNEPVPSAGGADTPAGRVLYKVSDPARGGQTSLLVECYTR